MAHPKFNSIFLTGTLLLSSAVVLAREGKVLGVSQEQKSHHTIGVYRAMAEKIKGFLESASVADNLTDTNKLMINLTKEFGKGKFDDKYKQWSFAASDMTIKVFGLDQDGIVLAGGNALPQIVIVPTPDANGHDEYDLNFKLVKRYQSVFEFTTMDWLQATSPNKPGSAYYVMAHISHYSPFGGAPDEEGQLLPRYGGGAVISNVDLTPSPKDGKAPVVIGLIPGSEPKEIIKSDKDVFSNGEVKNETSIGWRYWDTRDVTTMRQKFTVEKPRAIWIGRSEGNFLLFSKLLGTLKG